MPDNPCLHVIAYDIPQNKRRHQIATILQQWGDRIQGSVFECWLTSEQREKCENQILEHLLPKEDSLVIYPICQNCKARRISHGLVQQPPGDELLFLA